MFLKGYNMVKRFDVKRCMMQETNGQYVLYSDYAALESIIAKKEATHEEEISALIKELESRPQDDLQPISAFIKLLKVLQQAIR